MDESRLVNLTFKKRCRSRLDPQTMFSAIFAVFRPLMAEYQQTKLIFRIYKSLPFKQGTDHPNLSRQNFRNGLSMV